MPETLTDLLDARARRFKDRQAGDLLEADWRLRRAAEWALANDRACRWAIGYYVGLGFAPPGSPEYEDCLQEARLAVFRASLKFDPGRRSARTGLPVKPLTYQVVAAKNALEQWRLVQTRHGHTGVGDSKREGTRTRAARPASLSVGVAGESDDPTGRDEWALDPRPRPDEAAETRDLADRAAVLLDELADHDAPAAAVLRLRFLEGKTLAQAAEAIGFVKEWARQKEHQGLAWMRERFGVPEPPPPEKEAGDEKKAKGKGRKKAKKKVPVPA
jgi:RNA polymerase sigma factor (sigma-70 family)